jgi:hypothetical protein
MLMVALVAMVPALPLAACDSGTNTDTASPTPRPVRTTTVEKREAGEPLTFTGRIEAEDEISVAFRISGRLQENNGKLGDQVQAGQVMARLESQNELNTLRQVQAQVSRPLKGSTPRHAIISSASRRFWLRDGRRVPILKLRRRDCRLLNRKAPAVKARRRIGWDGLHKTLVDCAASAEN